MTTKLNIFRFGNGKPKRDRRVQRGSEKREGDGQDPCRQLSDEPPTESALPSQVVRSEFFAEKNYMATPDIAGEFDLRRIAEGQSS